MANTEIRLIQFVHRFVGDLGATMAPGSVVVGDRLGLYRALADKPMLPQEPAPRSTPNPDAAR